MGMSIKSVSLLTKSTVLGLCAMMAMSHVAHARQWYVLDFKTGTCVEASTVFPKAPAPQKLHDAIRSGGVVDEVKVSKDDDGQVSMVTIGFTAKGNTMELLWFPVADLCEKARKVAVEDGTIPDMNDLK
jgi:hypothetical protein